MAVFSLKKGIQRYRLGSLPSVSLSLGRKHHHLDHLKQKDHFINHLCIPALHGMFIHLVANRQAQREL